MHLQPRRRQALLLRRLLLQTSLPCARLRLAPHLLPLLLRRRLLLRATLLQPRRRQALLLRKACKPPWPS